MPIHFTAPLARPPAPRVRALKHLGPKALVCPDPHPFRAAVRTAAGVQSQTVVLGTTNAPVFRRSGAEGLVPILCGSDPRVPFLTNDSAFLKSNGLYSAGHMAFYPIPGTGLFQATLHYKRRAPGSYRYNPDPRATSAPIPARRSGPALMAPLDLAVERDARMAATFVFELSPDGRPRILQRGRSDQVLDSLYRRRRSADAFEA